MLGSMSQPLILYTDCLGLNSSITKHPSVVNSWESYLIFQCLGFFSFCKVELIPDSLDCEQDNPWKPADCYPAGTLYPANISFLYQITQGRNCLQGYGDIIFRIYLLWEREASADLMLEWAQMLIWTTCKDRGKWYIKFHNCMYVLWKHCWAQSKYWK